MQEVKYNSVEELLRIAKKTNGHKFREYNTQKRNLSKNKGGLGQIVEEGVFHYPVNSKAEADFKELGVELKVTGIKKNKNNTYSAKERLVLNIINYMSEYNINFEESSFWKKNAKLLLMFYLYEKGKDFDDFTIIDSVIHDFSDEDLHIIKNDWEIITNKIKEGKAETLSESDTMYLGACTKGENAQSNYRQQPNSKVLARQRAFSLKQSYMTSIVNKYLIGEKCEKILSYEELVNNTFEMAIEARLSKYYGKSENELFSLFNGINQKSKDKYNILIGKMLGIKGNINNSEEFKKANITLKTIRVEENGTIREHMSFPTYEYKKIVQETWEESTLKEMFESTKFMFVVFKKKKGIYYFEKIKFWNIPLETIERKVKPVWEKTVEIVRKGNIVRGRNSSGFIVNLPGPSFNGVCHTRPHDSKGILKTGKGYELPVVDKVTGLDRYTKYCFWLDKNYIIKIISS